MGKLNFQKDVLPFITATAGEWAALYLWLKFQDQDRMLVANVVLWAGFLVERISVILWLRYVYRPKEGVAAREVSAVQAGFGIVLITLSEIVIWIAWLRLADDVSFWLAAFVLLILMQAEHGVEMSLVKKTKAFAYFTNTRTAFFTLMEVAGAVGWLYLVRHGEPTWGALVLLVGLSIEHVLQGSQLKPDEGPS